MRTRKSKVQLLTEFINSSSEKFKITEKETNQILKSIRTAHKNTNAPVKSLTLKEQLHEAFKKSLSKYKEGTSEYNYLKETYEASVALREGDFDKAQKLYFKNNIFVIRTAQEGSMLCYNMNNLTNEEAEKVIKAMILGNSLNEPAKNVSVSWHPDYQNKHFASEDEIRHILVRENYKKLLSYRNNNSLD